MERMGASTIFRDVLSNRPASSSGPIYIAVYNNIDNSSGGWSTMAANKAMPKATSIDVILSALSASEKEEFIRELFDATVALVNSNQHDHYFYLEELRKTLIAWEYTAHVKSNEDFLRELEEIRREIDEDSSSGVEWTELLGG